MPPSPNAAALIERSLTVALLRGDYPVGSRLPTVRELAQHFGVNPATVQRALSRLELTGLVSTRQGSGIRVNDPKLEGDLSLLPAWMEACAQTPERAATILDEFLEVRRALAARLMVRHRLALLERAADLAALAQKLAEADTVEAIREADLAFSRAVLETTRNSVAMAVLNTAARVLREVPHVAQAMYAEPDRNRQAMAEAMQTLLSSQAPLAMTQTLESAMAALDAATVRRFLALLKGTP